MKKTKATSPNKLILASEVRTAFGKKLRKMRIQGNIPGNVYGTDFKSQSVTLHLKDFLKAHKVAKETGVIYLTVGKEEVPVLIRGVQKHPVTDIILHVDFRKIDLKKKIETAVPVKSVGVSEAVTQKGGVLLTLAELLLVEALPQEIPSSIEIDISLIKEVGQEIKVADLKKSETYVIKDPPGKVIFSVVEHKEESVTPETTTEQPEVITEVAKPEEEPTTGTAEKKSEEKTPPATPEKKEK